MQGLQAKRSAFNPGATVVCIKLIRMLGIVLRSGCNMPACGCVAGCVPAGLCVVAGCWVANLAVGFSYMSGGVDF